MHTAAHHGTETRDAEQALIAGAAAGADGFTTFYRHFEQPMLRFHLRATGRPELAADLTAETFARALESITSFDGARGRADQWLFGIARHVLAESVRRGRVEAAARSRLGLPPLVLDDHAADAIARLGVDPGPASAAMADLSPDIQQAIRAHVLDERPYADIAAQLDCSEALVRQRVSRGLRALRTRLTGDR